MKYDDRNFEYIFPSGGDCEQDSHYESRWVEIKQCKLDESITEIEIPEGVKVIGDYAFINYVNLKKITFPSTLTVIRKGAFECCKALEAVEFKNPVVIDQNAFRFCESLKSVEVNFSSSRKTAHLIWENRLKPGELPGYYIEDDDTGSIWKGAFKDCPSLKEIRLCPQMKYFEKDEAYKEVNIIGGKAC